MQGFCLAFRATVDVFCSDTLCWPAMRFWSSPPSWRQHLDLGGGYLRGTVAIWPQAVRMQLEHAVGCESCLDDPWKTLQRPCPPPWNLEFCAHPSMLANILPVFHLRGICVILQLCAAGCLSNPSATFVLMVACCLREGDIDNT